MKRLIFFASIFLGLVSQSMAKEVDVKTAKQAAEHMYAQVAKCNMEMQLAYTQMLNNTDGQGQRTAYYIFNAAPGQGFVIVAADDSVLPILAYSTNGNFDASKSVPNFQWWMSNYQQQIEYVINHKVKATADISMQWQQLLNEQNINSSKDTEVVAPLLMSIQWDQSPYVNDLCPYDEEAGANNGYHCPTGCPATAMAMIMKYWEYPINGEGSHSYYHYDYGNLSADFAAETYDWAAMPPAQINSENLAVATLMYHCGVAVEMDYGPEASGSFVIMDGYPPHRTCEYAFKTYFDYNPNTLQGLRRYNYSDVQWNALLKAELDAGRPIQYAGFGEGGHTFIFDGYDENQKYHVNWGWGGYNDGYFEVDNLSPGGGGTGAGGGHFNNNQQALIGIQPMNYQQPLTPDAYESNNTFGKAKLLSFQLQDDHALVSTTAANIHVPADDDYYKLLLIPGKKYIVKPRVHDSQNSANDSTYTCDVSWSYRLGNGEWSEVYDDVMPDSIYLDNGGILYVRVFSVGDMGTYLLDIDINRVSDDAVEETLKLERVEIYPNPVKDILKITANVEIKTITLIDKLGQQTLRLIHSSQQQFMSVSDLPSGTYFLLVETESGIKRHKFIKQ